MKDVNFLFTLETLSETIPYTKGLRVKEGVLDIFKRDETFGDKVKGILETVKEYVQVLIETAQKWFNIVIGETSVSDPLFRIAGGITFGSLALLVIALLYKAGKVVLGESTTIPHNVIISADQAELVVSEFELPLPSRVENETYAYIVLACFGLVAVIVSNALLKQTKLGSVVAAWSVAQIAASDYVFYTLYKNFVTDASLVKVVDDKIMVALGIIVGGLSVLTGVTVTIPAIIQLLKNGPTGTVPSREQVDEINKTFNEVKDTPEAQDIRQKLVNIYNKALKA